MPVPIARMVAVRRRGVIAPLVEDELAGLQRGWDSDMQSAHAFAQGDTAEDPSGPELEQAAYAADRAAKRAADLLERARARGSPDDAGPRVQGMALAACEFAAQCYALSGSYDRSVVSQDPGWAQCHAASRLDQIATILTESKSLRVKDVAALYTHTSAQFRLIGSSLASAAATHDARSIRRLLEEASGLTGHARPQSASEETQINTFVYWIVETQLIIKAYTLVPVAERGAVCDRAFDSAALWTDFDVRQAFSKAPWQHSDARRRAIRMLARVASELAAAFRHDSRAYDRLAQSVHSAAFDIVVLEQHKTYHRLSAELHVRISRADVTDPGAERTRSDQAGRL